MTDGEVQNGPPRPLIVYGHKYCGQARLLAEALEDEGIQFEWRNVMGDEPAYKEQLRSLAKGCLSVPTVVFPDGTVLVEPRTEQVFHKLAVHQEGLVSRLRKRLKLSR